MPSGSTPPSGVSRETRWGTLRDVLRNMRQFPAEPFTDSELPFAHLLGRTIYAFPLGDFRTLRFDSLVTTSQLYIGHDRRLYEYGPSGSSQEDPRMLETTTVAFRHVDVMSLEYTDLRRCLELLRLIWL